MFCLYLFFSKGEFFRNEIYYCLNGSVCDDVIKVEGNNFLLFVIDSW